MASNSRIYMTASELAEMLGVSMGHSYKIIRQMNNELEQQGYIVVAGKIPKRYVEKRYYGYNANGGNCYGDTKG